eukprot:7378576-Prymnesium_polylepis.1
MRSTGPARKVLLERIRRPRSPLQGLRPAGSSLVEHLDVARTAYTCATHASLLSAVPRSAYAVGETVRGDARSALQTPVMGRRRTFRYRPKALVEADILPCLRASESSDLDDTGH